MGTYKFIKDYLCTDMKSKNAISELFNKYYIVF